MQELPLNGFYESTTQKNSARRCVNLIPINEPNGSLSTNMLECPSGLNVEGPHTAASANTVFDYSSATSGSVTSQVFKVSVSPNTFATGTAGEAVLTPYQTYAVFFNGPGKPGKLDFADGFDYARLAASQSDIVICSPGYAPGVSVNGSYAEIPFPGNFISSINVLSEFPLNPRFHDVTFAGGRFVWVNYSDVDAERFRCYYTDIGDTLPKATQFFSPDESVSRLTGVHNLNGSLWVFDSDNAYLFSITSSVTTPFQWQRSATKAIGCAGPHAKAEVKGALFVLGRVENGSYSVVSLGQGRVSTPAVDAAINAKMATLDEFSIMRETKLFGYRDKGRDILAVTVSDITYCYNITDNRWFEMGSDDAWEVVGFGSAFGKDVFIGRTITVDGPDISFNMSEPDSTTGQEFGVTVSRYFDSAFYNANNAPMKVSELEPVVEVGGTADVSVSVSKDYGDSFGAERSVSITDSGYGSRTRFLSWGLVRQALMVRVRFSTEFQSKIVKLLSRISTGGRGA